MLELYYNRNVLEAGTDEAGRGCLCGPVYAAAVILPANPEQLDPLLREQLNDSKQLTEAQRYALRPLIERDALAWAVATSTAQEIDSINILNASIQAMHRALDGLELRPQHILVDGNRFHPYIEPGSCIATPHLTVIHGDARYMSIAAASVLAKTYRDDYMLQLHEQFPQYHWDQNKGYPTRDHREAIRRFGTTPHHRMTFRLL